jgi:hypothetical protein
MNIKDFNLLPTGWKVLFTVVSLSFVLFALALVGNIVILFLEIINSHPVDPYLAMGDIIWLIGLGALLRWILTKKVV